MLMSYEDNVVPAVGLEAARKAARARMLKEIKQISEDEPMSAKPNFEKLSNDAAAQGKEGMDALMQSSTLFAKGAENLVKTCMTLAQDSAEKSAEAVKALMSCKTLNELTETQSRLAQDGFDQYMSGITKLSELTVKLATDSFQPLNTQVTKAMKKATDAVAA